MVKRNEPSEEFLVFGMRTGGIGIRPNPDNGGRSYEFTLWGARIDDRHFHAQWSTFVAIAHAILAKDIELNAHALIEDEDHEDPS